MPRAKSPAWTSEERAVLIELYPALGLNGVADALPDRSWQAIYVMANKLGLRTVCTAKAPEPKLQGQRLEEAIRLREVEGWSFARIGAHMGVAEASACNAVLIALCPRKGFRPAERDATGRLTPEGLERLRYALRKGMKGLDIQLRLGVSASCVAEQRRRYQADLKARDKAPLPPPGAGAAYSGVKVAVAKKREVEGLLLEGFGAKRVTAQTGVSNTTVGRIRNRLVKRLARKGECLPGCDLAGRRIGAAKASTNYIPPESITALRERLLAREPVARAARRWGLAVVPPIASGISWPLSWRRREKHFQPPTVSGAARKRAAWRARPHGFPLACCAGSGSWLQKSDQTPPKHRSSRKSQRIRPPRSPPGKPKLLAPSLSRSNSNGCAMVPRSSP
ncbi:hypothetical protein [Sphingomonas sp. Ant H11]|uniref:hypothetical protein n=1 Tax=Sphingomonas sp. Ant H11 TaxID=1564113 RepID=UPI00068B2E53|nr:hypothetical protein [Sphingomonas sp. Ant H11]